MKKTLVINLFGAPGAGKSTIAAQVFAKLKWKNIDCELVPEFAKDLVWEDRKETFKNQGYIFAKQMHRINRLNNKVEVIITDSPLLLSIYYDNLNADEIKLPETFAPYVFDCNNKYNNLNIFINRKKDYNPNGRNQTEEESNQVAKEIKYMLDANKIEFFEFDGTEETVDKIVSLIYNIYIIHKIETMGLARPPSMSVVNNAINIVKKLNCQHIFYTERNSIQLEFKSSKLYFEVEVFNDIIEVLYYEEDSTEGEEFRVVDTVEKLMEFLYSMGI